MSSVTDRPMPEHICDTCEVQVYGCPYETHPCQQEGCDGTLVRLVRDEAFWERQFNKAGYHKAEDN